MSIWTNKVYNIQGGIVHTILFLFRNGEEKIMYGENKKDLMEIIKELCEMKSVQLIDGRVCVDHIHMYIGIPPKLSVSEFMSYLKGKSSLMFFDRHPELKTKYSD